VSHQILGDDVQPRRGTAQTVLPCHLAFCRRQREPVPRWPAALPGLLLLGHGTPHNSVTHVIQCTSVPHGMQLCFRDSRLSECQRPRPERKPAFQAREGGAHWRRPLHAGPRPAESLLPPGPEGAQHDPRHCPNAAQQMPNPGTSRPAKAGPCRANHWCIVHSKPHWSVGYLVCSQPLPWPEFLRPMGGLRTSGIGIASLSTQ
jgi:hypothetical protein